MDVVICVSSKDCLIVKKTVFYIHRNIESDNIYLITDKHSFGFFSKRFRSRYNISLIDEEEIEFGPGLNILTGETGAGKSIVVGSAAQV